MNTNRRRWLALALLSPLPLRANTPLPTVTVWKDPSCGCCGDWIRHMQAAGFPVRVREEGNAAARARLGLPATLGSCHTAEVAGYVVEGHVPAADVQRLLRERPPALGLAVPGMPVGAPGMDGPAYGGRQQAFEVLLVGRDGKSRQVFAAYPVKRGTSPATPSGPGR